MKIQAQNTYIIPLAIIIVGILISGVIIATEDGQGTASQATSDQQAATDEFRMPSEDDHIRGARDAAVYIIEFSDFECPFCGRLHPTLSRIEKEHDDVAWVYRHFPLNSHSNAFSAGVASECMARLGGNETFWHFADTAFANQRQLGNSFYESFAKDNGIAVSDLRTCLDNPEVAQEVQKDLDEVIAVGGRGTPHVVVVSKDGARRQFSGALPYEQIMGIINQMRSQ